MNARAFLTALSDSSDEDSDRESKPTLLSSAPINQSRVTRSRSPSKDIPAVTTTAATTRQTRSNKRSAPVAPEPKRTRRSKVVDTDDDDVVPEPKRTRLSKVIDDDDDELLSNILDPKSPPKQPATKASKKRKSQEIEPEEANGWDDITDESPILSPPTYPLQNEQIHPNQNAPQSTKSGVSQAQKIVVGSALRQQKTSKITMLQEPSAVTAHLSTSSSNGSQSTNQSTHPINKSHEYSRSPTPLTAEQLLARKNIEAFADALTTCAHQDGSDNLIAMRQWRSNLKSGKFKPDLSNRLTQHFAADLLTRLRNALKSVSGACKAGLSQGSLSVDESEQLEFLGNALDFLCYANEQFGWKPQLGRDIKMSINGLYNLLGPHVGDHNRHWQKLSQQIYAAATQIWPDITPVLKPLGNSTASSRIPRTNTTQAAMAAQFSRSKHIGSSVPRPNTVSANSSWSVNSESVPHRPTNNVFFPSQSTSVNSPSNFNVVARVQKPLKPALRNSTGSSGKSVQWKPDDQLNQIHEIERIGRTSVSSKSKNKDESEGKSLREHVGEPDVEPDESIGDDSALALNHSSDIRNISPRNASPRATALVTNDSSRSASLFDPHVAPIVDHSYSFVPPISPVNRDQPSLVAAGAPSTSVAPSSAPFSASKQLVRPHLSLLQCLRDTGAATVDQPVLEPAPPSPPEMPPPLEAIPELEAVPENQSRFTIPIHAPPCVPVQVGDKPQGEPDHPMPEVSTSRFSVSLQVDSSLPPLIPDGSSLQSSPSPLPPPVPVPAPGLVCGISSSAPVRPPPVMFSVKKEKIAEPSRTQLDDALYLPVDLPEFPFSSSPLPNPLASDSSSHSPHAHGFSSVVGASGDVPVLSNTEVVDEERRKRRQTEKEQRELDREQKLRPTQPPTLSREQIESMRTLQELGMSVQRKQRRKLDLEILQTRLDDFRQEEKRKEDMSKPLNQRPSSLL